MGNANYDSDTMMKLSLGPDGVAKDMLESYNNSCREAGKKEISQDIIDHPEDYDVPVGV